MDKRYEDIILPFLIESSGIRGRAIRLGPVLKDILTRHDYPDAVSRLLGELLVLTAMLGSTLKSGGTLSMQISGDGPVNFMVADATYDGELRGYADIDTDSPVFHASNDRYMSMRDVLGNGHLAITMDPGGDSDRYQGIVALEGDQLAACVTTYFEQSEQVDVALRTEVGHSREGDKKGIWEGAAIMLQKMPGRGTSVSNEDNILFLDFNADSSASYGSEDWNRALLFLRTATKDELLDPFLPLPDLLFRLFHEDGVRIFDMRDVNDVCRCSRERIYGILLSLDAEEREDMMEDGKLSVTCQFCNREEIFTGNDF